MSVSEKQQRAELYDKLIGLVRQKLPDEQVKLLTEFIPRYYSNVAVEDIVNRDVIDLYGSLMSHWHFIYERAQGEAKVRVYNPYFEKHGWQSTHTIIEISHDDMPFLVDSTRIELNRRGLTIHFLIHLGGLLVCRNEKNQIIDILPQDQQDAMARTEAPILFEIDHIADQTMLDEIKHSLEKVLSEVRDAVYDWQSMKKLMEESLEEISTHPPDLDSVELSEYQLLLRWLIDDHFTFLGSRKFILTTRHNERGFEIIDGSSLGILKDESHARKYRSFIELPHAAQELLESQQPVIFSKRAKLATVHRNDYLDRIEIKKFNENGEVTSVICFIGLLTSVVYNCRPKDIPVVRTKVLTVMELSKFPKSSHGAKELLNILETLPRDDLFHCTVNEISELARGILYLQERRRVRLFVRHDIYGRFISCLVYIPRERFESRVREKMQNFLCDIFKAKETTFTTRFSDSILARVHFLFAVNPETLPAYDLQQVEKRLAEIAELWTDNLRMELVEIFGEGLGSELSVQYHEAFPAGYVDNYTARSGAYDVQHIEQLDEHHHLSMNLYQPLDVYDGNLQFKLYGPKDYFPLSDVLPILENMGLKVISEIPYLIAPRGKQPISVIDFSLLYTYSSALNLDDVKDIFQQAFANIWYGKAENDGFNRLVLAASLDFREVSVLRAYSKYLAQIRFTLSQSYIESALSNNPVLTRLLVELFNTRFEPTLNIESTLNKQNEIEQHILSGLDTVANFDEDRIIRRFLEVIKATVRTNYFQVDKLGEYKGYLSFKLDPSLISDLPKPVPLHEIWVYSPRVEGVHLRGGKVARGGLRWSDRREDFRTEVLGLMKAQQVKNSVIVPSGAKGGFVPKCLPVDGDRDEMMREVIACYQNFIRGLLDVTDNLQGNRVIPPSAVIRYDHDDPYLVVAADKGTATFSDIANAVSREYGFWLDDAFASGGSAGYDHKKMAITARGAWECVKRHFRTLDMDIQKTDFTVIGIGDMSGDVFGNGMLLSRYIKLVAAMDHRHIFIDPNPDPEISFVERQRLFDLPRSSWEDYNSELISKGGGVFKRSVKSIKVTREMKELLDIEKDEVVPTELMQAILKAKVDLFWNGGIGTFVKATTETHQDVGDRSNEALRVNASDLRARVIGEGGNLGITQLARVEYELNGGRINTDFIDNSGGVDCSDREVNCKILLNSVVENGDLTLKQRNHLLVEMTDEIAALVIRSNYKQAQAISLASLQAKENPELYIRYIAYLEEQGRLDRALEFIPDEKVLLERKMSGNILTRPEISVLLAYTKIMMKQELQNSELLDDPDLFQYIKFAIPTQLRKAYTKQMLEHRLRREIIANVLSNDLVNHMGLTFAYRLQTETGCNMSEILKAYLIAAQVFNFYHLWHRIEELDNQVKESIQEKMMISVVRMMRRSTRWLLRNRRVFTTIANAVDYFSDGIKQLQLEMKNVLIGLPKEIYDNEVEMFVAENVPESIAAAVAGSRMMFSAFDIIEAATQQQIELKEFALFYFMLGHHLELGWLRSQLNNHLVQNQWEGMAIAALRDDVDWRQRALTSTILQETNDRLDPEQRIESWINRYLPLVERWQALLLEMRTAIAPGLIMYSVALRELLDLNQASQCYLEKDSSAKKKKVKVNEG
jgi:glutamate dehydrogenase